MNQQIQETVKNEESVMKKRDMTLGKALKLPVNPNYSPDLDSTKELNDNDAVYYQSIIGILRWIVEMRRIDTGIKVSMLSSYVANPREGHLIQVLQIFAYLKVHHNARLVFDLSYATLDENFNEKKYWSGFYGNETEPMPSNTPKPFRKRVYVTCLC